MKKTKIAKTLVDKIIDVIGYIAVFLIGFGLGGWLL